VAPRWEYQVEVIGSLWRGARPNEIQQFLTDAAEDNWELVEAAPIQNSSRLMLILRRPVEGYRRKKDKGWP
jgi:hypothetical protein